MTDETESPERIWVETRTCTVDAIGASRLLAMDREFSRGTEYIRKDLSDAKDKRIDELEQLVATLGANLAKAVNGLERIAHASDVYGVEANAEDQGADTLAYAHKSTCNLARTTLAELKGPEA